jgi:hypothetical protein
MRRRWRRPPARRALGLLAALLTASGCGLGAGRAPSGVSLTVTRDFGARALHTWSAPKVRGAETAMSLLMRNARVSTRYSGGFVESVDGLAGGQQGGRPVDWFYYVNGSEAPRGAAATRVHPGDHIWWDRHDWSQTDHVPAVVGSFPEPFLNGIGGKRLPVRVECEAAAKVACRTVTGRLRSAGAPAAVAALGTGSAPHTLRVLVGTWPRIAADPVVGALARGPAASGVYARFSADGTTLTVLDPAGRPARRLGPGAGLIAASANGEDAPVWVITGTGPAGVLQAARDLSEAALRDRFALALTPAGSPLPVPAPLR